MTKYMLAGVLLLTMLFVCCLSVNAQGCGERPGIVERIYCSETHEYCFNQECVDGGRITVQC